jgi:hypothetical protein
MANRKIVQARSVNGPYQPVLTRLFAGLWSILGLHKSPLHGLKKKNNWIHTIQKLHIHY